MTSPGTNRAGGSKIACISSPVRLVALVCASEIAGMTPLAMFLALQPRLQQEWQLSNTTSGWIASAYYGGYMLAVPLLASLTDRFDARTVWLGATSLAAVAAAAFGLWAEGVWSAVVCQALAGASLAGTYMPGLKLIDDRMPGTLHPRYVAFYTTSFTLGSSGSYFLVGQLAEAASWRMGMSAVVLGPIVAWLLIYHGLAPRAPADHPAAERGRWKDVWQSGESMRYVGAYACHMWELFGMRAWLVPFLTFCVARQGETFAAAPTLAALIALVGVPASLSGAELSARIDRRRLVVTIMLLSTVAGIAFGLAASMPWPVILAVALVHHALVMGDSAALTSGLVAVSPPRSRGTAMALYSMGGFAAASAGSFATGAMLDLLGGQSTTSWAIAFAVVSASNLIGAALLWRRSAAAGLPAARGRSHRPARS